MSEMFLGLSRNILTASQLGIPGFNSNCFFICLLQANSDFFLMAELFKDYIGLIQAVKVI